MERQAINTFNRKIKQAPFALPTRPSLSGQTAPGAEQTLGYVVIEPGQKNPLHAHPNCEELLYLISGELQHSLDDTSFHLNPGDAIRVPAGAKHDARCVSAEPAKMVVCLIGEPDEIQEMLRKPLVKSLVLQQTAESLVFDIAQGLRNVQGMNAESVRKILDTARATFEQLAVSAPDDPTLQRSQSVMLSEFVSTRNGVSISLPTARMQAFISP